MQMKKWKTIVLLCALTPACDQANNDPAWRSDEPELTIDDEPVDDDADAIDHERIEEAFAQQTWEDALEELLDLECDARGRCSWVWTDLEALGLDGLVDELPEPPTEKVEIQPAGDLVADADPSKVFVKQVYLTSIRCVDRQEAFSDEPYLLVNGATIWSASGVENNESFVLAQTHGFNTQIFIDLWESDTGADDHIGNTLTVLAGSNGEYVHTFKGSDGEYRLYYTVSNWGA
jgi:hypothetical protein